MNIILVAVAALITIGAAVQVLFPEFAIRVSKRVFGLFFGIDETKPSILFSVPYARITGALVVSFGLTALWLLITGRIR